MLQQNALVNVKKYIKNKLYKTAANERPNSASNILHVPGLLELIPPERREQARREHAVQETFKNAPDLIQFQDYEQKNKFKKDIKKIIRSGRFKDFPRVVELLKSIADKASFTPEPPINHDKMRRLFPGWPHADYGLYIGDPHVRSLVLDNFYYDPQRGKYVSKRDFYYDLKTNTFKERIVPATSPNPDMFDPYGREAPWARIDKSIKLPSRRTQELLSPDLPKSPVTVPRSPVSAPKLTEPLVIVPRRPASEPTESPRQTQRRGAEEFKNYILSRLRNQRMQAQSAQESLSSASAELPIIVPRIPSAITNTYQVSTEVPELKNTGNVVIPRQRSGAEEFKNYILSHLRNQRMQAQSTPDVVADVNSQSKRLRRLANKPKVRKRAPADVVFTDLRSLQDRLDFLSRQNQELRQQVTQLQDSLNNLSEVINKPVTTQAPIYYYYPSYYSRFAPRGPIRRLIWALRNRRR